MFIETYRDSGRPTGHFTCKENHWFQDFVKIEADFFEDVVEIDADGFCQWKELPQIPFIVLSDMNVGRYILDQKLYLIWATTEESAIEIAREKTPEERKGSATFQIWNVEKTESGLLEELYAG
jgi:hypothetical protein